MIDAIKDTDNHDYWADYMYSQQQNIINSLRFLSASVTSLLSQPAPDVPGAEEVDLIRKRHEKLEAKGPEWRDTDTAHDAHADRATLLRLLDAARPTRGELEANAEVEAIRHRHATDVKFVSIRQTLADRATLLRLLDAAREELREAEAANTALKDLCLAAGDLYKGGGVFPIKGAVALRLLKAGAQGESS